METAEKRTFSKNAILKVEKGLLCLFSARARFLAITPVLLCFYLFVVANLKNDIKPLLGRRI